MSSDHGGIIRIDATEYGNNEALGPTVTAALVNNANHLADESGQVLVNLHLQGTSWSKSWTTTGVQLVASFGPFFVRGFGPDNVSRLRVRINGQKTGAGTCRVWLVYSPAWWYAAYENASTDVLKATPPGSYDWMTTQTAGSVNSTVLEATLDAGLVDHFYEAMTIDGIAGSFVGVPGNRMYVHVLLEGLTSTGTFNMRGLYAAEFADD